MDDGTECIIICRLDFFFLSEDGTSCIVLPYFMHRLLLLLLLLFSCLVLEDVLLVEFMYLVFTRMAGENTVGDSGHCCCTCAMYFER